MAAESPSATDNTGGLQGVVWGVGEADRSGSAAILYQVFIETGMWAYQDSGANGNGILPVGMGRMTPAAQQ